ncbi:signal transduction histidine kinase [Candidatus Vecturithrix granuli]|uniref:histidine kinase n=1 Tax=Vecturithrix granuli TaxID=1499967 RepID=A0A081BU31_VECG1|nr:signal transduction histidine kinase [Candidatus Vecturithrix granuli]
MKDKEIGKGRFSRFRKRLGEAIQKHIGLPVGPEEIQQIIEKLQDELDEKNKEIRQLQAQLEGEWHRYDEFYNSVPLGYCLLDRSGRIIEANLTLAEQLGVEKRLLIGTRFDDHIIQEDLGKFSLHLEKSFEEKTIQRVETRLTNKAMPQNFVQVESVVVSTDEYGSLVCQTSIRNITDLVLARESLLRRESELAFFNRVSRVFESTTELTTILMTVLEEVRRLLEVTACSIWLCDHETGELVCEHAIGPYSDAVRGWRLSPGQGIVGWVASTGRSLIVSDAWADDRHFRGVDLQTGQVLRSILAVPMLVKDQVIGVLQVLDDEIGRFTLRDQALQELLAALAGLAIENAHLFKQTLQNNAIQENLLHEINHRVENTMAIVINLFSMVRRHAGLKQYSISRDLMTNMLNRVRGLKVVHDFLSELNWHPLPLSEITQQVIQSYLKVLEPKKPIKIDVPASLVRISPEQGVILALIIYELVSNTVKHGLAERESGRITVHIAWVNGAIFFKYQDDGPGYQNDFSQFEHHNLGIYLIQKIVQKNLYGKVEFYNDQGAVTTITFEAEEEGKTGESSE